MQNRRRYNGAAVARMGDRSAVASRSRCVSRAPGSAALP